MHGVQAKANAIPMSGAAQTPSREGRTSRTLTGHPRHHAEGARSRMATLSPGRALSSMTTPSRMMTAPLR